MESLAQGPAKGGRVAELEYKTITAPRRLRKVKGVKGRDELLAYTIGELISAEAAEGWRYLRTDSFTIEEKSGFFSKPATVQRSVLVFARELRRQPRPSAPEPAPALQPVQASAPAPGGFSANEPASQGGGDLGGASRT